MLKVLYIHHASEFSGAGKSLVEMWRALAGDRVDGTVLCPRGLAAKQFKEAGLKTIEVYGLAQWSDIRSSYFKGLRWLILLRELYFWPITIYSIFRLRNKGAFDVIHANEITLLLPAMLAKRWLGIPLVIHVRSVMRGTEGSWISRRLNQLLAKHADVVVAIDETVRESLPDDLKVSVVHNSMNVPKEINDPASGRGRVTFALIGVLRRQKGVYEYVEAARICRDRGLDLRFLLVGDNVRKTKGFTGWLLKCMDFSVDTRFELESYVKKNKLENSVEFIGFVEKIQTVYPNIDVLCFPSHMFGAGRPVFEAAFFGVPSIVAVSNPRPDTIVHGETGLCINTPEAVALADAIEYFARNPEEINRMGNNAKQLAYSNFNPEQNSEAMFQLYCAAIKTATI